MVVDLQARDKRPANLANVGYAVEKKNTTAQSHNQGGRS
jgi:hypothetical protein